MGKKKKSSGPKQKLSLALLWKQKYLLLMSLPFVAWIILFKYVPLWGWTMAFQDVKPATFSVPIWERAFVGFENFTKAFEDRLFQQTVINTIGISILQIAVGTIVAILFAVLLNELTFRRFKKLTQTISYLPHFVSWVIIASIAKNIFNDGGVIDTLVGTNLHLMSTNSPLIWIVIVLIDCWKEMGWNAIIYLSAMAGIDPGLYEAAEIDGASEPQIFSKIVVPLSKPIISVITLFTAVGYWNSYFNAILYTKSQSKWTLQLVLREIIMSADILEDSTGGNLAEQGVNAVPAVMLQYASIVVAMVPILCVYPFIQKYFQEGIMMGAVKG